MCYNTSHLLGHKSLLISIGYVNSYPNLWIAIGLLSRFSYVISMEPYHMDYLWHLLLVLSSLLSVMLIRMSVLLIERTPVLIIFSLVIIFFHRNVPSKKWCSGPPLNLSIVPLPMLPLNSKPYLTCKNQAHWAWSSFPSGSYYEEASAYLPYFL